MNTKPVAKEATEAASNKFKSSFRQPGRQRQTPQKLRRIANHMVAGKTLDCPNVITKEFARPLRILHQLGGLDRGGIETWLMHVLRRTDRRQFQMDFFVRGTARGDYEDEIEALGSKIGRTLHHRNPPRFAADVREFVHQNGPYDIFHSHLSEYDGLIMWVAARLGIQNRISHSHNDTRCVDSTAPIHRRAYLNLGRRLIKSYSTHCLAASELAALSQFGAAWESDPKVKLLYYGIDLTAFRTDPNSNSELRRHLGIPAGSFVIGNVGRFVVQKNHQFLVKIVAQLMQKDPSARLLLVGSGPLLPEIKSLIERTGLTSRVILLEPRPDVPRLMLEAMDVFLLPSLHEGLGLVLLEAQAAGLPCVASDGITKEARVFPGGIEFLSLELSAQEWADRLLKYKFTPRPKSGVSRVSGTAFDITVSADRLFEFYTHSARS